MMTQEFIGVRHGEPALGLNLPPLPRSVRYRDEYEEVVYTLADLDSPQWVISDNGAKRTMDFAGLDAHPALQHLLKVVLAESLAELAPRTVCGPLYRGMRAIDADDLSELVSSSPHDAMLFWDRRVRDHWRPEACHIAKTILRFLCERWLGPWTPDHIPFVETAFPWPKRDKYNTVRDGSVFLDVPEEATLVRWLDGCASRSDSLDYDDARDACMVACCYQLGMRPIQLALIRRADVTIRPRPSSDLHFVHLRFQRVKRGSKKVLREELPRSLTASWTPLFLRFFALAHLQSEDRTPLFGFPSAVALGSSLNERIHSLLGDARTAYDLRHTAAQRLVDAGASIEEVAQFLGHSTLTTSLIYFGASANQAEQLNKALGASAVYGTVRKIATDKFISDDELRRLKGDQQIAGVPHGIPICGIGGCNRGQPHCPFDPVMACYDCPDDQFLPISDVLVHREVLRELRGIVLSFEAASRGEMHSPAYMQLRRTISGCQSVIATLTEPKSPTTGGAE